MRVLALNVVLALTLAQACAVSSTDGATAAVAGAALVEAEVLESENPAEEDGEPAVPKTQDELESACPEPQSGDAVSSLRLKAEFRSSESSKDSNSSLRRAEFDGRLLTFWGPYGTCVRGRCKHGEVTVELSEEEVAALEAELDKLGLWSDVMETTRVKIGSPSVKSTARLEMSDGIRTARSIVESGWSRATGERIEFGSPEARKRSSDIGGLVRSLASSAKRCYPALR